MQEKDQMQGEAHKPSHQERAVDRLVECHLKKKQVVSNSSRSINVDNSPMELYVRMQ